MTKTHKYRVSIWDTPNVFCEREYVVRTTSKANAKRLAIRKYYSSICIEVYTRRHN